MTPLVSVIVPCRNEVDSIGRCLDSILASDYPGARLEVIVADGMSQDGTREVLDRYTARDPRVRRIDNLARTTPHALNSAIAAACGDLILRLDAHARIASDYIAQAVEALESSGADCVGGAMRTLTPGSGVLADSIRIALSHPFGVGNAHFRTSSRSGSESPRWVDTVFGACWRRDVFERIGRFDERLERSQDIEFSSRLRRAGGKILMSPEMKIDYYPRVTVAGYLRQNWSNGMWAILPFAHVPGFAVRSRHLIPLALVVSLAISAVAAVWSGIGWLGAGTAVPYLVANLAASSLAVSRERRPALAFLMPLAFSGLHLSYGAGSLWGCARAGILLAKRWTRLKPMPEPAA